MNSRQHLYVNDEPTVEVDFRHCHPAMLYALRGLAVPEDPYTVPSKLTRGVEVSRDVYKTVSMCVLNATSPKGACSAITKELAKNGLVLPEGIAPKHVRDAYVKHHAPVAGDFYKGNWRLMYLDSQIAERVLLAMTAAGIPCFAIHDSFVVPASAEELLAQVMTAAWTDLLGQAPRLKRIAGAVRLQEATNGPSLDEATTTPCAMAVEAPARLDNIELPPSLDCLGRGKTRAKVKSAIEKTLAAGVTSESIGDAIECELIRGDGLKPWELGIRLMGAFSRLRDPARRGFWVELPTNSFEIDDSSHFDGWVMAH
ncbi:Hypothetical protein I5071_9470 [Sandaracinus amylolyticus]|nr:Hypothetical protein I5071_9470 [Sandaracinus amylolyticus]